jgi:hypothetical protein
MIDYPNRAPCMKILDQNAELFRQAPGSTHNHQAWRGGYWHHVTECMNIWLRQYSFFKATGRMGLLPPEERFTKSDGLLVLFLHDIEKPWRCVLADGNPVVGPDGRFLTRPGMERKAARQQYAQDIIREMGVVLTPNLENALRYVEGIRDSDYTPGSRIMLPLAALCHTCDLLSARAFYAFPSEHGDTWGPGRISG